MFSSPDLGEPMQMHGLSGSYSIMEMEYTAATLTPWTLTDSKFEVVEGMLVYDVQLPHQRKGKLHHGADVHVLPVMVLRGGSMLQSPDAIPLRGSYVNIITQFNHDVYKQGQPADAIPLRVNYIINIK